MMVSFSAWRTEGEVFRSLLHPSSTRVENIILLGIELFADTRLVSGRICVLLCSVCRQDQAVFLDQALVTVHLGVWMASHAPIVSSG